MKENTLKKVAIVGVTTEAADLFKIFLLSDEYQVVKVLNPDIESVDDLQNIQGLNLIINTCLDYNITHRISLLRLQNTEIMGGLSAHFIFCLGYEELKQGNYKAYQEKILNNLQEIRRAVTLANNREELLKLILTIALKSLKADGGSIMLIDPQKKCLTIEIAQGLETNVINSTSQKIGKGIAGQVARTGKPIIIKGKVSPNWASSNVVRTDLASAMCAPLVIGQEVVGVLNINSKSEDRLFSTDDLQYVQQIANLTADIIRTSQEYETVSRSAFIFQLTSKIRDILQLEYPIKERLNLMTLKIATALQAETCNYYAFNKEQNAFYVQASSSLNVNLLKNKLVRLNEYFTKKILQNPHSFCFHLKLTNTNERKWYLIEPVRIHGELAGCLFLQLVSDRESLDRERSALDKIAKLLGQELSRDFVLNMSRLKSIKYSALSEITFDFGRLHNVRQLARVIVTNACLILDVQSCILSLYNKNMDSFEILEGFSLQGTNAFKNLIEIDKKITRQCMESVNVCCNQNLLTNGVSSQNKTSSSMTMCLRRQGMKIGSISVYDKVPLHAYDKHGFTQDDVEVFMKFCLHVSKALERFIIVNSVQQ